MEERLEAWVAVDGFPCRFGFRIPTPAPVAGGPLDVAFTAVIVGERPLYLGIGGDRARRRSAGFVFRAAYDGVPLADPRGDRSYLGGPSTVAVLETQRPFVETVSLHDFVALENTVRASGLLRVDCLRAPDLAWEPMDAVLARREPVGVELRVRLERDDDRLAAVVAALVADVWSDSPQRQDAALTVLTSLRADAAVSRWAGLREHPSAWVRDRVAAALPG